MSFTKSPVSFLLFCLAWALAVVAAPNDGPQYYTDSVVVSGGSTSTVKVLAEETPYYVSSTSTASTETFLSTSATTLYETFSSYATYESASTTTWYPTCSGTITVTTSIMIPYDYFRTIGTSFVSELVYKTVYISGTSTSTELATTTTSYVVSMHDTVVTTAPTDLHTAPFSLTFPCATTTVTQTLSYEPAVITQVQVRQTVATTYSSSESYYTMSTTSYTTETSVSTLLIPYPVTTSGVSVGSSTTSVNLVIYPQTSSAYSTYVDTDASATTATYHVTAAIGMTTTTMLMPTGVSDTTLSTVVSPSGTESPGTTTVATTVAGAASSAQTSVPPAATGAGSSSAKPLTVASVFLSFGILVVFCL